MNLLATTFNNIVTITNAIIVIIVVIVYRHMKKVPLLIPPN